VYLSVSNPRDIAYHDPDSGIYINSKLLSKYPDSVFWFAYYHELGHSKLHKLGASPIGSKQWAKQEEEATVYALKELLNRRLWDERTKTELLRFIDDIPEMRWYRPIVERFNQSET
jgi:hypothetical protein